MKRFYSIGDVFDDMACGWDMMFPTKSSYSFRGQFVDTEKFDIIPKRNYLEKELREKEEELRRYDEMHKIAQKQRQDEIDSLKKKLTNKLER